MNQSLYQLRQATAELLACAVCDLFPGAQLVEAGINEFGFFYDFVAQQPIDAYAIPLIEEKMRAISKADFEIRALAMMRENAVDLLQHHGQSIKADIVAESSENIVSICQIGEFYDYCPALAVETTGEVRVFKILKIEKVSYQRPDWESFPVVRIRGSAFADLKSLKKFIKSVESAKKRDHRLLIKEMELCLSYEEEGGCDWFWQPRGAVLRDVLRNWWYEEHRRQGFVSLTTPAFVKTSQLRKFGEEGGQELPVLSVSDFDRVILPSRSPLHALYFRTHLHSYRELPVRYAECAQVYNLKKDGELWGIFNTLFVEADAAHIFCSAEQVEKELISSLQFIDKITKILGFELYWCLGGRASKSAGTLRQWEAMTLQMQRAFEACNFECFLDKEAPSFAGPVAQAYVVDALGREWKGPRLAIDFNYTERLGLRYQAATDSMEMPIMLIRTIFGSLERWIALLLEHFGGMLPLWLAPEQVRVLSVGEGCKEYAETVASALENKGLRVGVDFRPEQLGKKIHQCENKRIPYLVIVGEKEKKQDLLTVRSGYSDQVQGGVNLENFLNQVKEEIENKSLPDTNRKDKHRR